jgi:hypothetical protein
MVGNNLHIIELLDKDGLKLVRQLPPNNDYDQQIGEQPLHSSVQSKLGHFFGMPSNG